MVPVVGGEIPCLATSQPFVQELLAPNAFVMLNILIIKQGHESKTYK